MLFMSFIAVLAMVTILLLSLIFSNRAAAMRATAAQSIEADIVQIQKKSLEADQKLVDALLAGTAVEAAIAQFQRERARLMPMGRSDEPWSWSSEDLDAFRAMELQRQGELIRRRLLVPAVASTLGVFLLALGILAALYQWNSNSSAEPRSGVEQPAPIPPALTPSGPFLPGNP